MSVVKHFIEDSIKKTEIDEFLQNEFERAGYGGVSITKTPLGTHLVIYTMRPGLVIGRGGETIRALAQVLEEKFQLPSPQISVAEIEIPELNAYVVASRIASALKRGVHYRRAGFWGLTQTMEAGALGAEVIISGKLRTDRARYEKFKTGYLPKSGDPPRQYMRKAELHVQTKPGILGVKVRLLPPDAKFPDQVKVQIVEEEIEPETAIMEEPIVTKKTTPEPEALPPEETVPVEETPIPSVEEKVVTEEKIAEPEVPNVEEKTVAEEPTVEPEAASAKTKKKVEPEAAKTVVVEKEKKTTEKKVSKPKAPEKKAAKPKVTAVKEETAAKKKKVSKAKAAPAKEKKVSKKKVAKPKAASAKTKKEAEK
jgi:small subunit ribosomal protein S3